MDANITIILFVVALLFSVGFLLLIISLIPAINQFRSFMTDMEKTSTEVRDLTAKLKIISEKVDNDLEKIDIVIDRSKDTLEAVSRSVSAINKNVVKHSAGILTLLPALKFVWGMVRKNKGGKNV